MFLKQIDVAVDVEDLLDPIPAEKPYTQLKDTVINRVAKSANRMLQAATVKRQRQPVMATTAAGQPRPSRLFYITDKSSGLRFLVDTGAE
ncbi:unnamed protein product, partial [Schistocephalus solidus]|uniref:Peptidase A2 domain-containing protein n=1 Tax=Schistocephalus solidus TaxID=70667 RepID=A0A183SQ33_SCHSO